MDPQASSYASRQNIVALITLNDKSTMEFGPAQRTSDVYVRSNKTFDAGGIQLNWQLFSSEPSNVETCS